jgi:hypothetical protein
LFTSLLFSSSVLLAAVHTGVDQKADDSCPCFFEQKCSKWYVGTGVSFGDLFYFNRKQSNNLSSNVFAANDAETENTVSAPSLGYNVFLGYSFNKYIDLELKGVQLLRSFQNKADLDVVVGTNNDNFKYKTKLYAATFGPYVLLNLPLFEAFTPFFRFGMVTDLVTFKMTSKEHPVFDVNNSQDSGYSAENMWLERLNVGLGFKSTWKDLVAVKVEYETPLSNNISGRYSATNTQVYVLGILSASVLFKF